VFECGGIRPALLHLEYEEEKCYGGRQFLPAKSWVSLPYNVMRIKNKVNSKFIITSLVLFILICFVVYSQTNTNKVYALDLYYKNGNLAFLSKQVFARFGDVCANSDISRLIVPFILEEIDNRGNVLYSCNDGLGYIYVDYDEENLRGGSIALNETQLYIKLPTVPEAKKINIYRAMRYNNTLIKKELALSIDLLGTSECGNNRCESGENYFFCSEDCPSGSADKYCDTLLDNVCDKDCSHGEDGDCDTDKDKWRDTIDNCPLNYNPGQEDSDLDSIGDACEDITPPITQDNYLYNSIWINKDALITLTATDDLSGVKETYYCIGDSSCVPETIYKELIQITTEGISYLRYYSIDNVNNKEDIKESIIKIDKTAPELSLALNPNLIWPPNHKEVDVKVEGYATDSLSGVKINSFKLIDEYNEVTTAITDFNALIKLIAWREGNDNDGRNYTINAISTDNAGNNAITSAVVLVPHDERK